MLMKREIVHTVIVNSNLSILRALTNILREYRNFAVTGTARDAESALIICRQNMPDVVLIDGDLPSKESFDLARALKSQSQGVFTVLMSSDDTRNNLRDYDELFDAYFDKYNIIEEIELLQMKISEYYLQRTTA